MMISASTNLESVCVPPLANSEMRAVLLVEDDLTLQRFLEIAFKRAGFRVFTASDAEQALSIMETERIAAVVTDAMLPKMGGRELCRHLRLSPAHTHIATLLLTGLFIAPCDTLEGVDACLQKPTPMRDIINCVSELISNRFRASAA